MTRRGRAVGLKVGQFSHPGRKRSNNEDWLGTFQPVDAERLAQMGSLFVVADGMGGHQSGELASRFAVDQVIRTYMDGSASDVGSNLKQSIESANAVLYAESEHRRGGTTGRGWGTTLVAAVVRGDKVWIANVGDSRAYLLQSGRLLQVTEDHALGAGSDVTTSEGAVGRHIITRALGRKPAVEVDLFPPRVLDKGDRVLLCSDGLTTPLTDEEILQIAAHHPPQKAVEALVRAANERGGPDNVSVILLEVTDNGSVPGEWQDRPWYYRFLCDASDALQDLWLTLVDPGFWRKAVAGIERSLPGSEQQSRTFLLIGLIMLAFLLLMGLGFVLGIVLL